MGSNGGTGMGAVTRSAGGCTAADVRTPLRHREHFVWVCPASGSVRLGRRGRHRTLVAGLDPASYLLSDGSHLLVALPGDEEGHGIALHDGATVPLGPRPVPAWSSVVEAVLPPPSTDAASWLEAVVTNGSDRWRCSIPQGTLPAVQAHLAARGLRLSYIARRDLGA